MILLRRCRRCRRDFPEAHFRRGRKSCRTCLEDVDAPTSWVLVLPRPRPVRRKWPRWVLAHKPRPATATSTCLGCGAQLAKQVAHQAYCSAACRQKAYRARVRARDADGVGA